MLSRITTASTERSRVSARRLNAQELRQLRDLAQAIRENLEEDVALLTSAKDAGDAASDDDVNASAANLVEAMTDYLLGRWRFVTAGPEIEELGGELILCRLERRDYVILDPVAARAEALRVDPQGPDDIRTDPAFTLSNLFHAQKVPPDPPGLALMSRIDTLFAASPLDFGLESPYGRLLAGLQRPIITEVYQYLEE